MCTECSSEYVQYLTDGTPVCECNREALFIAATYDDLLPYPYGNGSGR